MNYLKFVDRFINLNLFLGSLSGMLILFAALCMLITVSLRYIFGIGAIYLQEACIYAFALAWWLCAARTLHENGHVRVDIFYRKLSLEFKKRIDLFGHLFLLIPCGLSLVWLSLDYVERSWMVKEISTEPGGLPWVYLLKSVLIICPLLLSAHALMLCINIIKKRHLLT